MSKSKFKLFLPAILVLSLFSTFAIMIAGHGGYIAHMQEEGVHGECHSYTQKSAGGWMWVRRISKST